MKFRRLLFAALLALCFDVAVPFELSAQGTLVWEDDEEEAVRADKRRPAGARQRTAVPRSEAVIARARLAMRRRAARPTRRVRVTRVVHDTAPPPLPSPTEDH